MRRLAISRPIHAEEVDERGTAPETMRWGNAHF